LAIEVFRLWQNSHISRQHRSNRQKKFGSLIGSLLGFQSVAVDDPMKAKHCCIAVFLFIGNATVET